MNWAVTDSTEVTPGSIHVVAAALMDAQERVLLAQRPSGKHLAGFWEFPGGKVEPGESPLQALQREIREEVGVEVLQAEPLIQVPWAYPGKHIVLDVFRVRHFAGEPRSCEGQPLKWVPASALDGHEMPAADHPVIHALQLPAQYLITPSPQTDTGEFLQRLDAALARGVRLVQLRARDGAPADVQALARECRERVHAVGGSLLINGHAEWVEMLDLDGVHVPAAQLRMLERRPVGAHRWFAASCHDADELALAQALGADFAVLGPVAATPSHPHTPPMGWQRFESLCAGVALPVYALGGMRVEDQAAARAAGAQGIAAISALW